MVNVIIYSLICNLRVKLSDFQLLINESEVSCILICSFVINRFNTDDLVLKYPGQGVLVDMFLCLVYLISQFPGVNITLYCQMKWVLCGPDGQ